MRWLRRRGRGGAARRLWSAASTATSRRWKVGARAAGWGGGGGGGLPALVLLVHGGSVRTSAGARASAAAKFVPCHGCGACGAALDMLSSAWCPADAAAAVPAGAYLASMRKTLAKVLAEGRSSMVLVDAPHERAADVKEVWTQGQVGGPRAAQHAAASAEQCSALYAVNSVSLLCGCWQPAGGALPAWHRWRLTSRHGNGLCRCTTSQVLTRSRPGQVPGLAPRCITSYPHGPA